MMNEKLIDCRDCVHCQPPNEQKPSYSKDALHSCDHPQYPINYHSWQQCGEYFQAKPVWDQAVYEKRCREVFVPALEKEFGIKMEERKGLSIDSKYWHSEAWIHINSWSFKNAEFVVKDGPHHLYIIIESTTAADLIAFFRQYVPKKEKGDCKRCEYLMHGCAGVYPESCNPLYKIDKSRNCVQCGEYRGSHQKCNEIREEIISGLCGGICKKYHAQATCWNCEYMGALLEKNKEGFESHICSKTVIGYCYPHTSPCHDHKPLDKPTPIQDMPVEIKKESLCLSCGIVKSCQHLKTRDLCNDYVRKEDTSKRNCVQCVHYPGYNQICVNQCAPQMHILDGGLATECQQFTAGATCMNCKKYTIYRNMEYCIQFQKEIMLTKEPLREGIRCYEPLTVPTPIPEIKEEKKYNLSKEYEYPQAEIDRIQKALTEMNLKNALIEKETHGIYPGFDVHGIKITTPPASWFEKVDEKESQTIKQGEFDGDKLSGLQYDLHLTECPHCDEAIPDNATYCSCCGKKIKHKKEKKVPTKPVINTAAVVPMPVFRVLTQVEKDFNVRMIATYVYDFRCRYCKYNDNSHCKKYNCDISQETMDHKICELFESRGRYCKRCQIYHGLWKCPICHKR